MLLAQERRDGFDDGAVRSIGRELSDGLQRDRGPARDVVVQEGALGLDETGGDIWSILAPPVGLAVAELSVTAKEQTEVVGPGAAPAAITMLRVLESVVAFDHGAQGGSADLAVVIEEGAGVERDTSQEHPLVLGAHRIVTAGERRQARDGIDETTQAGPWFLEQERAQQRGETGAALGDHGQVGAHEGTARFQRFGGEA